jgi:propionyl-CoA synthetase
VASFKQVLIVEQLPKTRSGKILRGIIRRIVAGEEFTPPSTIENPAALKHLAATLQR